MTVSARKRYFVYLALSIAIIALLCGGVSVLIRKPTLSIGDTSFSAEIVDTNLKRQMGLSGRNNLPEDSTMVFVFDGKQQRCFWMKDMRFAIDIVWLDETKRVVAIERSVQPSTYPESFCHDGMYVAEFVAGTADKNDIEVGSQSNF